MENKTRKIREFIQDAMNSWEDAEKMISEAGDSITLLACESVYRALAVALASAEANEKPDFPM